MQRFGLVGHPNAGKSSLFNVMTGAKVLAAPYPFATVDANVGVAAVPDERLDKLAVMSQSPSVVPASVHFTDIGGLVKGASEGEGLGNQFLAAIREADAIVYVLRAFKSKDLPPPDDLKSQLDILEVELSLADLESAEKQLEKRERQAKAEKSPSAETAALQAAVKCLQAGAPIYKSDMSQEERANLEPAFLLTNKPVMAVLNTGEDADIPPEPEKILELPVCVPVSVGLEAEAMDFEQKERRELLASYGIQEDGLSRFISSAYRLLGLKTFFTTGPKETRAWTFPEGATAAECAGKIHSDMERGFIRADCIQAPELIAIGSEQQAKSEGKIAGVGRDYTVQDGDVLTIRFNV